MGRLKAIFIFMTQAFQPLENICWFSRLFFDIHDYHTEKGGDGFPSHFYSYTCHNCGAEFTI
jgi:hypothetical protein